METQIKVNEVSRKTIHVLVIEDDPDDADIIQEAFAFGSLKPQVTVIADGERALKYLRNTEETFPDLILLDLNLPKLDGRHLLRELRTDMFLKNIPVIVMTTSSALKDIDACRECGINSFITKPNNFDEFSQIVQHIEDYWLGFEMPEMEEVV